MGNYWHIALNIDQNGALGPNKGVLTTFPKGFCPTAIWGQEGLIPIITYPTMYRHMLKYFLN